ncbi:MAG: YceI family protein [Chloroflexi bacterium]|nr:YceI family protein [Chloroflexota bacterium]
MSSQREAQRGAPWVLDPVHSSVQFAARHMVVATVRGGFAKFEVTVDFDEARPEGSQVEARIDAASIDTREPQRDTHLRSADFLDVEKHPWISFKSSRVEPQGDGRYRVVGDLTIRGVTRQVALETSFAGLAKDPWGNQRAGFSAEASISRKEFGLNWNVALEAGGWLVGDTVKINIEAELFKKLA